MTRGPIRGLPLVTTVTCERIEGKRERLSDLRPAILVWRSVKWSTKAVGRSVSCFCYLVLKPDGRGGGGGGVGCCKERFMGKGWGGRVWLKRFADCGFDPKHNCGFLFRSKFLSNLLKWKKELCRKLAMVYSGESNVMSGTDIPLH